MLYSGPHTPPGSILALQTPGSTAKIVVGDGAPIFLTDYQMAIENAS